MYVVCLVLYPLAFAGFVIGFGCPVWIATQGGYNHGLWQLCTQDIVKNCTTFNFDSFDKSMNLGNLDWLIGVRAVEIFALVMLTVAAADLAYENCFSTFRGRQLTERLAPGVLCILGGLGGLAGIITYAVKTNDYMRNSLSYGWALALVAAGSGLAVIIGVGFCVSGCFLESRSNGPKEKHTGMNGTAPYSNSNTDRLEMHQYDNGRPPIQTQDNLPGFSNYNGLMTDRPGQRMSLPPGPSSLPPAYNGNGAGPPPVMPKSSQYYSVSDDRLMDPSFDLSEGYVPSRTRRLSVPKDDPYSRGGRHSDDPYSRGSRPVDDPYARGGRMVDEPYGRGGRLADDPYSGGRAEDPFYRGRSEEPYSRGGTNDPTRAGYNDPYGFDRDPRGADRASPYGRGGGGGGFGSGPIDSRDTRDSFYRPGRF